MHSKAMQVIVVIFFGLIEAGAHALSPRETTRGTSLQIREWTTAEASQLLHRTDCLPTKFGLEVYSSDVRDEFGGPNLSRKTSMLAFWETDNTACLKRFGIVQWIRGCVFNSIYEATPSSNVSYFAGTSRKLRGRRMDFNHPEWVVDTDLADPLYCAPEDASQIPDRHGIMRWVKTRLGRARSERAIRQDFLRADDSKSYRFLFQQSPPYPQLYVGDNPTSGYVSPRAPRGHRLSVEQHATNSALEFEVCLYPIESVPLTGDPARPGTPLDQGGPLHCMKWESMAVFNHLTQNFKPHASIQDCQLVPWRTPRTN